MSVEHRLKEAIKYRKGCEYTSLGIVDVSIDDAQAILALIEAAERLAKVKVWNETERKDKEDALFVVLREVTSER